MGFKVLRLGFKVLGLGFEVLGLGFEVLGLGFEVLDLGSNILDLGSEALGLLKSGYAVFASDVTVKTSISRSSRKCFKIALKLLDFSILGTHFKIKKILKNVNCRKTSNSNEIFKRA